MSTVIKQEVEAMLGTQVDEEMFNKALSMAKAKQIYIYNQENRQVVLQDWYLVTLTKEYVISLAFSKFTMDLCEALKDMEKEHQTYSAPSYKQPYYNMFSLNESI